MQDGDEERERELTRIEVLKWKAQVERIMASARNLGRQGERYRARAEETCEWRLGQGAKIEGCGWKCQMTLDKERSVDREGRSG